MKAAVQTTYAGPTASLLAAGDVDEPVPGPTQVLVRVEAAAVSRGVWHIAVGKPYAARLAFGLRRPRNPVPGMDLAGTVVAVGAEVTSWAVGDRVLGAGRSTWASSAVAEADRLRRLPDDLDVVEAGALPDSGCTAWNAVHKRAQVAAGEEVLVIGASGGVGAYAVQLAAYAGARVTGVASAAKRDAVLGWGAQECLDYRTQSLEDAGRRFDVIVDLAGNRPVRVLRRVLAREGRLVIGGGEDGGPLLGGQGRMLRAAAWSLFTRQRMGGLVSSTTGETVERLLEVHAAGGLRPTVTRTYPLADAGQALDDLERGRITGKAVVVP